MLGKEGAGEVVQIGPECRDFALGDRVVYSTSSGSYAEYTMVDSTSIVKIPQDISYERATAAFIQGLTAITLTEETYAAKPGEWALVHAGAGSSTQG